MATISELVQRCVTRLGMVGGTSVQVYAEDIISEMLRGRFFEMFESTWWLEYMRYQTGTLVDGGYVGETPSAEWGLRQFRDIKHIYHKNDPTPLKLVPGRLNQRNYQKQESKPRFFKPVGGGNKIFQVLPYGVVGEEVQVHYRQRPQTWLPDDELLLDDMALIYGTCYDYLEDDGTNPGATEKMRNFYNERLEQLNASRNEQDISLIPDEGKVPDYWQVY